MFNYILMLLFFVLPGCKDTGNYNSTQIKNSTSNRQKSIYYYDLFDCVSVSDSISFYITDMKVDEILSRFQGLLVKKKYIQDTTGKSYKSLLEDINVGKSKIFVDSTLVFYQMARLNIENLLSCYENIILKSDKKDIVSEKLSIVLDDSNKSSFQERISILTKKCKSDDFDQMALKRTILYLLAYMHIFKIETTELFAKKITSIYHYSLNKRGGENYTEILNGRKLYFGQALNTTRKLRNKVNSEGGILLKITKVEGGSLRISKYPSSP